MPKLGDRLTKEKLDSILAGLLPNEKSPRRRMNRFESFMYSRAGKVRVWTENWVRALGKEADEGEMYELEKRLVESATLDLLFEFEVFLREESGWTNGKRERTPEAEEAQIMENQPGRWLARFPHNRGCKNSRNVSGVIYDAVVAKRAESGKPIDARGLFDEISTIMAWHPELEDGDRVSECRWSDELNDWEIVVVKPDGEVVGNPTKTIEEVVKEGVLARSRRTGAVSGRELILGDAFLGILVA